MDVREEIDKYAAEDHKHVLHWLLTKYRMQSQFRFVARCRHEKYGPHLYQSYRVWYPTPEGLILYRALACEDESE